MKKIFFCFIFVLFICIIAPVAFAEDKSCENNVCKLTEAPDLATQKKSEINAEITRFFDNFTVLQNKHNIAGLKKLYYPEFMNTDGYNKTQLFALMEKTFKSYPDIKNTYKIDKIIATDTYAMVYVSQTVSATTKETSKITGDKGQYSAQLQNIFYLKKLNNKWQIYSENVTYESSILAFGNAKGITAELNIPQKVLAGSDYSAGVKVDVPIGFSAIASINNTQIVDGFNMSGETFRQVPVENTTLERILKANNDNNNEAVVVSIGFTQVSQDLFKKAKVDLSGLMMLMQRVDIIPQTSNLTVQNDKNAKK